MKESIDREEERQESRRKYFYFPVEDVSRPMSEMLHIAHDHELMARIGKQIEEHLAQQEAARRQARSHRTEGGI